MQKNLEKVVLKDRKNRMRIRSIVKHLQRLSVNNDQLRLVILEEVVYYLQKNKKPYSKREIYSAFELIPKSEYDDCYKNEIINRLSSGGKAKSVFTKQPTRKPPEPADKTFHAFLIPDIHQSRISKTVALNHYFV